MPQHQETATFKLIRIYNHKLEEEKKRQLKLILDGKFESDEYHFSLGLVTSYAKHLELLKLAVFDPEKIYKLCIHLHIK